MTDLNDIVGKRFGELRITRYSHPKPRPGKHGPYHVYEAVCSCGAAKLVQRNGLLNGSVISCGHAKAAAHQRVMGRVFARHRTGGARG